MARPKSYIVSLTEKERKCIRHLRKKTKSNNAKTRYDILLEADESKRNCQLTYSEIAAKTGSCVNTVISTLRDFCEGGLKAALTPQRNPNSNTANLKVTGEIEALIISKACSQAPKGSARWTLTLLHKETITVLLEEHNISLSRATIGRVLNRNDLRPHLNAYWCIPPEENAEFVANMEDILDLYHMPYDPKRPLYCMDEKPYQILDEARKPLPMRPGDIAKLDSEYVRNGTVSIFCFINPHTGAITHFVEPTRTAVDWAEKIVLVMENLNTHSIASLYKAFPPKEARRIASRLEVHYTPKHGNWLDIAEITINIMTRECLNRRIPSIEQLRAELHAWNTRYNNDPTPINWQFTNEKSRIKLKRLYPDINRHRNERDDHQKKKLQAQMNS